MGKHFQALRLLVMSWLIQGNHFAWAQPIAWSVGDHWQFHESFRFNGPTFGPGGYLDINLSSIYTCTGIGEYRQPRHGTTYLAYRVTFHGEGNGDGEVMI